MYQASSAGLITSGAVTNTSFREPTSRRARPARAPRRAAATPTEFASPPHRLPRLARAHRSRAAARGCAGAPGARCRAACGGQRTPAARDRGCPRGRLRRAGARGQQAPLRGIGRRRHHALRLGGGKRPALRCRRVAVRRPTGSSLGQRWARETLSLPACCGSSRPPPASQKAPADSTPDCGPGPSPRGAGSRQE